MHLFPNQYRRQSVKDLHNLKLIASSALLVEVFWLVGLKKICQATKNWFRAKTTQSMNREQFSKNEFLNNVTNCSTHLRIHAGQVWCLSHVGVRCMQEYNSCMLKSQVFENGPEENRICQLQIKIYISKSETTQHIIITSTLTCRGQIAIKVYSFQYYDFNLKGLARIGLDNSNQWGTIAEDLPDYWKKPQCIIEL